MKKTKRRRKIGYQVPMWLVWAVITAEYAVAFADTFEKSVYVYLIVAYAFLTNMLVGNYHGKQVQLCYEQLLSLWVKLIFTNVIMQLVHMACKPDSSIMRMITLLAIQIVTVWLLNVVIGFFRNRKEDRPDICFYSENKPLLWKDMDGVRLIRLEPGMDLTPIYEQMDNCKRVYLYDIPAELRNDLMKCCIQKDISMAFTAKLTDIQLRSSVLTEEEDQPVFVCRNFGIAPGKARMKRFFDFVFAGILLILLSWLFAIIAVCIKLEDKGPVFYRQTRCTNDMKEFKIIKFRSMIPDAEAHSNPRLASEKDDRLTKVGYILRKTKLDELPQLFNILKGDMSFVGPRPERPELIKEIVKDVPEFVIRTKVPAGLTGYAQVHGRYHTGFLDKLKWDLMYIENYSLLLDAKIILMTIPVVLRGSDDV